MGGSDVCVCFFFEKQIKRKRLKPARYDLAFLNEKKKVSKNKVWFIRIVIWGLISWIVTCCVHFVLKLLNDFVWGINVKCELNIVFIKFMIFKADSRPSKNEAA